MGKINHNKSVLGNLKYFRKYLKSVLPSYFDRLYADAKFVIDRLQNFKRLRALFLNKVGYPLNLESPASYNEKINWKKVNDRNPLLTLTADKYNVRSYIRESLGEKEAEKILIPLYYITHNPSTIPFGKLPEKFVIKPNHGSKMHAIVREKKDIVKNQIISECKDWLKVNYGIYYHEWAYRNIEKRILVEKLLEKENGELPEDIKFYCFHGKCKMIRVTQNRFDKGIVSGYFDENWNLLNVGLKGCAFNFPYEKPLNLSEMFNIAEKLSVPFDYVRVDLYNVNGKVYFGEFTHYEASGFGPLEPESFDYKLGEYWRVQSKYWLK